MFGVPSAGFATGAGWVFFGPSYELVPKETNSQPVEPVREKQPVSNNQEGHVKPQLPMDGLPLFAQEMPVQVVEQQQEVVEQQSLYAQIQRLDSRQRVEGAALLEMF